VFRRLALPTVAVALGVLLALLAFLQYRWLGQVSDGERRRMQATLEARARDFATDFDKAIGLVAAGFSMPSASLANDPSAAVRAAWDSWQAASTQPHLVRAIFVIDRGTAALPIRRFDPASRTLVEAEWPEALQPVRERWRSELARLPPANAPQLPTRVFIDDLSDVPAVLVPAQPTMVRLQASSASSLVTVVWLDLDEIRRTLLPSLVRKYFASDDVFDYRLSVRLRRDPRTVLFDASTGGAVQSSAGARGDKADASVPMFRIRMGDILGSVQRSLGAIPAGAEKADGQYAGAGARGQQSSYSISVMRLEGAGPVQGVGRPQGVGSPQGAGRGGAFIAVADSSGGWVLRLVHSAGSLDAAVEKLRRRNLVISSTIIGLLAVSLGFVLVSTRRAQRLAAQQVEFVASVSHELRTPLAVIRSAGENLADGVVETPEQVRRYGALVADEGRKLGAMVEQVMEFAGMQSEAPRWRMAPTDVRTVVDEAVAGARRLPEFAAARFDVAGPDAPLTVEADRAALVRAVQNLVENALKYGRGGQAEGPAGGGAAGQAERDGGGAAGRGRDGGGAAGKGGRDGGDGDASGPAENGAGPRVWVRIAAEPGGPAGRTPDAGSRLSVVIEVADDGPGVEARERQRIFEPFVRGRAAIASGVSGNGLGLSIVRRVVEGHGGRVTVRNRPEGGAAFTIRLPSGSARGRSAFGDASSS
jgi:signal transduction histidine kinase